MKRQRNHFLLLLMLTTGVILLPGQSFSQPPPPPPPQDVPFDGGLSLLLAAGAGYGIRQVRRQRALRKKGSEMKDGL